MFNNKRPIEDYKMYNNMDLSSTCTPHKRYVIIKGLSCSEHINEKPQLLGHPNRPRTLHYITRTSTSNVSSTLHLPYWCTLNSQQRWMGSMEQENRLNYNRERRMARCIMCCRSKLYRPVERHHQRCYDGNVPSSITTVAMKPNNVQT